MTLNELVKLTMLWTTGPWATDHEVAGSNPARGGIQLIIVWHFIAQSFLLSFFHHLDVKRDLKHQVIILAPDKRGFKRYIFLVSSQKLVVGIHQKPFVSTNMFFVEK